MPTRAAQPAFALPAVLLLLSGACALIYQSVWLRELRLVFGASTAANAAVLAIFMGGLGLGSLLLGRLADRHAKPLRLYGWLELGVALSAALSPLLVDATRALYAGLGGTPVLGTTAGTLLRLGLSALVLGLPTFLMGGTLAAAVRAVQPGHDGDRWRLGMLYALNTLGSVGGVLLATFVTIEAVGIRGSLTGAVILNLGVAAVAIWRGGAWPARDPAPAIAQDATAPAPLVLAGAAVAGFAFLLMELVWYRVLAPLLGGSSYSFGVILAVALLGIGLGSLAYGAWARGRQPSLLAFGATAAIEAVLVGLPLGLGDDFALAAAALRPLGDQGFWALGLVWALIAAAAILPAAVVSGFQFPLLVGLLGRGDRALGKQVGLAAGFNTGGAILGSLAGGFGLVPVLGAVGLWRLVVLMLLAVAALAAALSFRQRRTGALGVGLLVAVGLALATATGPTAAWRHSPIGAGRASLAGLDPVATEDALRQVRRSTLWEVDGVESALALQSLTGNAFVIHGKVDGHVIGDAPTNLWLGLLPTLLHPDPRRVLVIGLGTGQTAGWAAAADAVQSVDVIELEPAILDVARACSISNHGAMENPKLRVHLGDAREWLMASPERYDIIVSEPSNPYRAGIASLFSEEFYRATQQRLEPGGLLLQWVQAYELSEETLATAFSTLQAVFPEVQVWEGASDGDLLLVASLEPLVLDPARISHRMTQAPWRDGLAKGWRVEGLPGLMAGFVGGSGLVADVARGAPINTDDHPVIEFGFARHLGQAKGASVAALRDQAVDGNWDQHPIVVDPGQRLEARHSKAIAGRSPPGVPTGVKGPLADRMAARVAWAQGDLAGAAAAWDRQPEAPTGPLDPLIMGEAWASQGDARAFDLGLKLSEGEAALVRAAAHQAMGDRGAALDALVAAFQAARLDPWVHPLALARGLEAAGELSRIMGPPAAEALLPTLLEPFAEGNLDEHRRAAALRLLPIAGFERWCLSAFATVEPHPPFHLGLLRDRQRCYRLMGHPLQSAADADVALFLRLSGGP